MEEVQEAEDRSDVAFEELKEKGLVEIYVFWERDKMMLKKKIRFTSHAEDKLTRLVKIGVTKEKVIETIKIRKR